MNIVVCAKLTPDASDIEARPDGSISLARADWTIGNFDLPAIEAGVRLAESSGGKVTVLSAGPAQINQSKLRKDLLSRGPAELYLVVDEQMQDAGTHLTAWVLAAAVRKLGPVDLVVCGEGSADLYFQQVGLQLGELLGWTSLNAISSIQLEGERLVVERSLEEEVEVLEIPLPAVLSVTTDIHQARLPGMKEIMTAGKKPVVEWSLADLELESLPAAQVEVLRTQAPKQKARKQVIIPGSAGEAAQALAAHLKQEGIL